MKIIGLVGSNGDLSYNRKLLQYIAREFDDLFEMEVMEIKGIPLFNQSQNQTNNPAIQALSQKIIEADGVIISTPEHNHTLPPALKSVIEWLSFKIHPFDQKPVMIVGASYYDQGSSRAQLHLRQILNAPGVNAFVLPGNEFLLGKVKEAFDQSGNIKEEKTIQFLGACLAKFVRYVQVISLLNQNELDFETVQLESKNQRPQ